jgi:hypothetical protein
MRSLALATTICLASTAFIGASTTPALAANTVVVSETAEATSSVGVSIVSGDTFTFTFTLDLDSQAAGGTFNNAVTAFSLTAGTGNVGTWSPVGVTWQISPVKNVVTNNNSDQLSVQIQANNAPAIDGVAFEDLGITLQWNSSVVDVQPTVNGNSLGTTLGTFTPDVAAAAYFFELRDANFLSASFVVPPIQVDPPAPNANKASSSPLIELRWEVPGDASCSSSEQIARLGTWTRLPSPEDCTPATSFPDAKLLGWATDLTFPIEIAQRQVNNGWGAYETFNNDGQLTGVFIPAGGYTLLSNDTNLYPIWSS